MIVDYFFLFCYPAYSSKFNWMLIKSNANLFFNEFVSTQMTKEPLFIYLVCNCCSKPSQSSRHEEYSMYQFHGHMSIHGWWRWGKKSPKCQLGQVVQSGVEMVRVSNSIALIIKGVQAYKNKNSHCWEPQLSGLGVFRTTWSEDFYFTCYGIFKSNGQTGYMISGDATWIFAGARVTKPKHRGTGLDPLKARLLRPGHLTLPTKAQNVSLEMASDSKPRWHTFDVPFELGMVKWHLDQLGWHMKFWPLTSRSK